VRDRLVRTAIVGVCALAVLTALAACGSGVPASEWAGRVCSALAPWRTQISDLNARAQRQMSTASTPVQTRDNLLELLSGAETVSESARGAVAAAGTPDVDGGDEVARHFTASLEATRDAYARARGDLQALPTDDAEVFYDGVVAVMTRPSAGSARASSGGVVSPGPPRVRMPNRVSAK